MMSFKRIIQPFSLWVGPCHPLHRTLTVRCGWPGVCQAQKSSRRGRSAGPLLAVSYPPKMDNPLYIITTMRNYHSYLSFKSTEITNSNLEIPSRWNFVLWQINQKWTSNCPNLNSQLLLSEIPVTCPFGQVTLQLWLRQKWDQHSLKEAKQRRGMVPAGWMSWVVHWKSGSIYMLV